MRKPITFAVLGLCASTLTASAQPQVPEAPVKPDKPEIPPRLREVPVVPRAPNVPQWSMPNPLHNNNGAKTFNLFKPEFNRVYRLDVRGAAPDAPAPYLSDRSIELLLRAEWKGEPEVEISELPDGEGRWFWLGIANSSVASVLETLANRAGVRAVIDPELKKSYFIRGGYDGDSLAELLDAIGGDAVDRWRAPSGVYFFAHNPKTVERRASVPNSVPAPLPRQPDFKFDLPR